MADRIAKFCVQQLVTSPRLIVSLALVYYFTLSHCVSKIILCGVVFELVKTFIVTQRPVKNPKRWSVVIAGAGVSGLCTAKRLLDAGIDDFVILEKSARLGGTWYDNTYPGIACDIPSHLYSFSFFQNSWWPKSYSGGEDIRKYLEDCATKYGIHKYINFGQKVTKAVWDNDLKKWMVTTEKGDKFSGNFFVHATGGLHVPNKPIFKNEETCKKTILHTAEWNDSLDLNGKRVAVIGTGASAIQVVSSIFEKVKDLYLFQRTAAWVPPKPDFYYPMWLQYVFHLLPWIKVVHRNIYYLARELNFFLLFVMEARMRPVVKNQLINGMKKGLNNDPELIKSLVPQFEPGCKRITPSPGYLKAMQRDNVHLIQNPIEGFNPEGLSTKDGTKFEVDIIIKATGFNMYASYNSFECIGKDNKSREKVWGDSPHAYLGIINADFPNMFNLLGPSTALGHNTVLFMIECQVNYLLDCIRKLSDTDEGKFKVLDVKRNVLDTYVQWVRTNLDKTVFHSGCLAWYQDKFGFAWILWPKSCTEYWWTTYSCNVEDYIFE